MPLWSEMTEAQKAISRAEERIQNLRDAAEERYRRGTVAGRVFFDFYSAEEREARAELARLRADAQ